MIQRGRFRAGFTLVEVLVVIAIIGILVALLLPAIQSARESARRSQCVNNLRQIGIAVQTYHDSKRQFPCGRDGDMQTSVSWAFSLLPYMEEESVYKSRVAGQPDTSAANAMAMRTPVATFFCPSRRSPIADRDFVKGPAEPAPIGAGAAGGDYAANAGSESPTYGFDNGQPLARINFAVAGPMFTVSHVSAKQVVDGLSTTIGIGERYLPPPRSDVPAGKIQTEQGDTAFFSGDGAETIMRSTKDGFPKSKDDPSNEKFGSEHSGISHFVMLDGHVAPIRHEIDVRTFQLLSSIGDGEILSSDLL